MGSERMKKAAAAPGRGNREIHESAGSASVLGRRGEEAAGRRVGAFGHVKKNEDLDN